MDHDLLQQILAESFIEKIEWFETIDSTNTYVLQLKSSDDQLPLLVGAELQTQGRGRGQNKWWAGSGALTFSLLLVPETWGITQAQWPLISLVTGLALCEALSSRIPGVDLRLKWPNDLYANGRKVCGILLESNPDHPDRLVIGIGLNVNNSLADAPVEIQQIATSLTDLTASRHDQTSILIAVLNALSRELSSLGQNETSLIPRFRERCYLTGKMISVRDAANDQTGTCQGIDDDGALRIWTARGPQRVFAGVVTILSSDNESW
ncbi:MAG TPA: biotin--[acetyl-CoA-carboxylase] ligase [Planctomicrobium sp.]|nr:biotin--[acetyl-CoA-carboxylase] ligase [Planctomicrobium sp.]